MYQDQTPECPVDSHFPQDNDDSIEHHLVGNEATEDQNREEHFGTLKTPIDQGIAIH